MGATVKLGSAQRCALFDLDGVLLDTEPIYSRVIQSMVGEYGHTYDWSVKSRCMGRGTREAVAFLVEVYKLPLSVDQFIAQYESLLQTALLAAEPVAFAEAFTRTLHERGVPMAIVTSTQSCLMPVKTRRYEDWFSLFQLVVCGDHPDVLHNKPAPDAYLVAAREMHVPPSLCVVFEDAPAGVAAGKAAGMRVVAIPDPQLDPALFAAADLVLTGFAACSPLDLGF